MASQVEIETAARRLRDGGLVAFPTETVYGLGANAFDTVAVGRIYAAKGRPRTSPLIVHVPDTAAARGLAASWPPVAEALARAFWPGPLTLIVPKSAAVPDAVTAGLPTVGLRVPAHPVAQALLRAAGVPLAAPSANAFTRVSATRAADAQRAFAGADVLVLDGGPSAIGIESTVVAVDGDVPRLLRPGAISVDALRHVVGEIDDSPMLVSAGSAHASPGLHARHYSPRTPLALVSAGSPWPPGRVAWVHRGSPAPGAAVVRVELPNDASGFAAGLYAALHDLDGLVDLADGAVDVDGRSGSGPNRLDAIAIEAPPTGDPAWAAVGDRLRRAASP